MDSRLRGNDKIFANLTYLGIHKTNLLFSFSFALSGFLLTHECPLLRSGAGIEQPKTLFAVIPAKAGICFQELYKMLVYKKVQRYYSLSNFLFISSSDILLTVM